MNQMNYKKQFWESHCKGKKKPKDLWSNLREHKKTKESKKYVQRYESMKKNLKMKKIFEAKERSATKSF